MLFGLAIMPVHATLESDVSTILSKQQLIEQDTSSIELRVRNIYTDIHQYLPSLSTISTSLTNFYNRNHTDLSNIEVDTSSIDTKFTTLNNQITLLRSGLADWYNVAYAQAADVNQLQEVLASDEDLAIRRDQASRVDQINDDFLSSSGSASVSLGDLGSASDSITQLKGSLSGGASASSLWSVLGSGSDGWGWFSSATASDLDSSGLLMEDQHYIFLEQYYSDLGLALVGDYND